MGKVGIANATVSTQNQGRSRHFKGVKGATAKSVVFNPLSIGGKNKVFKFYALGKGSVAYAYKGLAKINALEVKTLIKGVIPKGNQTVGQIYRSEF